MKRLILVRHAEPDWPAGVSVGRNDPALSRTGLEQAAGLTRALAGQRITRVLSSSRARAIQTGEPIAHANGLTVRVPSEDFFNDFAMGDWEGKSPEQLHADPLFEAFLRSPGSVVPPGPPDRVESVFQMRQRVRTGLLTMNDAMADDECGVVVTHADIIRVALTCLLELDVERFLRFSVPRASITVVDRPLDDPVVSRLGWTAGDEL